MINFTARDGWQASKNSFSWRRQRPPGFASCTRHPLRNRVIVLLAAKAGLRAVEIAKLTRDMVVDPTGEIGTVIELRDTAAKNGSGRLIPVHPDHRQALTAYRGRVPHSGPLIRSGRGGPMTPLSIVVWFNRAFRNIGLQPLLVAFRPADVHHPGSAARAQGRWLVARCPTGRRSPVDPNHPTLHRR